MVGGGDRAAASGAARERRGSLVEREHDVATLRGALADAGRGRSAVVVIEGSAGIGKTRLLTEAKGLAQEAGFHLLTARASQLECELAFGVVRQLFEGGVGSDGSEPRLTAAAAAREVLDAQSGAADPAGALDASFSMLHSLHGITVALAADRPLVIAVDDLHWCDEPSLRFLNYLVRRLEGPQITMVCTVRPRARRAREPLVAEIVGDPLATSVRPGPLSEVATARLVTEVLGDGADTAFTHACHTATGGNPLLLKELLSTMQIEGVTPNARNVSAVADLGPRAVSRAVLVRLGRLGDDALRLARAASVLQAGADLPSLAELAGLAPDDAAAAASALATAEIFSDAAAAGFMHPLVGAAVYEDIPAHERSLTHERAARQLRDGGCSAGTVAVHLTLAPPRGREWVCDVLDEAAQEALRAGAPGSAVHYLARALSEPPARERRARLLLELGSAEAMLYAPSAIEHLTFAFEQGGDRAVSDAAAVTLARSMLFHGQADRASAVIRRAAAGMEPGSDVRLALEALEIMAAAYGSGPPMSRERFEYRLAPGAGPGAKMLAAVVSRQLAYGGASADECAQLALAALEGGELIAADPAFLAVTAILTLVRADRREADEHWARLLEESRVRGSLTAKAGISLWRGYAYLRRGALDDAGEALEDAREEHRLLTVPLPLLHPVFLSSVMRERGDLRAARRALHSIEPPPDASDHTRYWLDALVELLLAEERFEEAYDVATEMEGRFAFIANRIDTPVSSHRARALYHLGRYDEGLAVAAESLELARRWGAPGGLARALRVLGTLEREDGLDRLRDAVDAADGSVAALEHAKALVALGTALRRSRRPTEAREPLRRGLALAAELGAAALAAEARRELRAAGSRPRTPALTGPDALTPSERRVAERAAAGQTNRAIAEALVVTTKTVELHLSNAYRKLGVSSRRELSGKLGAAS